MEATDFLAIEVIRQARSSGGSWALLSLALNQPDDLVDTVLDKWEELVSASQLLAPPAKNYENAKRVVVAVRHSLQNEQ